MAVKVRCTLVVPVVDADPEAIFEAVQIDNAGYAEGRLEGGRLVFEVEGDDARVRATLNDLIVCLRNAMDVVTQFDRGAMGTRSGAGGDGPDRSDQEEDGDPGEGQDRTGDAAP